MKKYNHTIEIHNMQSPKKIVPILLEIGNFNSVVDVGCGLGTFLRAFIEMGITDVLGIDGKWCKKDLLFQNIKPDNFKEFDLEKEIIIGRKFDLAISLEVAEHLSAQRAESFVNDLCKLSDTIIFSAAVPFQGGDHHFNEQPLSYWMNLFSKQNYVCHDIIRPKIWYDDDIFWWYRQNIVLFTKSNDSLKLISSNIIDLIHPEFVKTTLDYKEKNSIKRHLKLLIKAIIYKISGK